MANRRTTHQSFNPNNGYTGESGFDDMETQNNQLIDGLRSKVGTLKSLTLDMGDEIKDQNHFLKDMDNTFDSSWGLLSSSLSRVKRLANSGQNRHILYIILFSFFVFFVIYIIMKFR
ncbi:BET1 homolog [Oppia nitens]|uniref:BET1 homolog n=1 Tax=Oppia nitens TaxID=1686743 RepID=UPI0023DCAF26|nr:BET1 homolog [Oppia nitens]